MSSSTGGSPPEVPPHGKAQFLVAEERRGRRPGRRQTGCRYLPEPAPAAPGGETPGQGKESEVIETGESRFSIRTISKRKNGFFGKAGFKERSGFKRTVHAQVGPPGRSG
jgi:hypothetical protein